MADPVTAALNVVGKVIDLVKILLVKFPSTEETDIPEKLKQLETDMGILNAVVKSVNKINPEKLDDGIKNWEKKASDAVFAAKKLLERFTDDHSGKKHRYSKSDVKSANKLLRRLDKLNKHNLAIIAVTRDDHICCFCFGCKLW